MEVPFRLRFDRSGIAEGNVHYLRDLFTLWAKRQRGEALNLEANEEQLADRFEELLHEKLSGPKPEARAFLRQLLHTFEPRRFQLLDLIITHARQYKTKEEVQAAIEKLYPERKWGKRAWQKAWHEFFRS